MTGTSMPWKSASRFSKLVYLIMPKITSTVPLEVFGMIISSLQRPSSRVPKVDANRAASLSQAHFPTSLSLTMETR